MKKMFSRFLRSGLVLALSLLSVPRADAQRFIYGQSMVGASVLVNPTSFGGEVRYGLYRTGGHWSFALGARNYRRGVVLRSPEAVDSSSVDMTNVSAAAGYMWRLVSSRSTRFSLYGGVYAHAGYTFYDLFGNRYAFAEGMPAGGFSWGAVPRVSVKFFVSRSVALDFSGGVFFNARPTEGENMFRPEVGFGFVWFI